MKNPTEVDLFNALKCGNGYLIRHFPHAPEYLQIEAVRAGHRVIRYIKNPSTSVQLEAVRKNPKAIRWIRNPHPDIVAFLSAINNMSKDKNGFINPK